MARLVTRIGRTSDTSNNEETTTNNHKKQLCSRTHIYKICLEFFT